MRIEGTHFINGEPRVFALVTAQGNSTTVPFVVDTGSAMTVLSSETAKLLGLDPNAMAPENTSVAFGIGGEVRFSRFDVGLHFLLSDGNHQGFSLSALVHESGAPLPSILGRDVLQHMELQVSIGQEHMSLSITE